MAIGILFRAFGGHSRTYDECITRLKKAGAGHPDWSTSHSSFGPSDNLSPMCGRRRLRLTGSARP